jgi:hypothetical protein
LQQARAKLPTDTRVRNDLGYALLLSSQFDAARFELLTVLELNPQDAKAMQNLVLLSFRRGEADQALALGRKLGLDDAMVARLREQANRLALPTSSTSVPPPYLPIPANATETPVQTPVAPSFPSEPDAPAALISPEGVMRGSDDATTPPKP